MEQNDLAALLAARQTILPKRLVAPGPDAQQLAALLASAAHAPDHGCLLPWRLVLIPARARAALGEAFVQALLARDAQAAPEQQAQAREKAQRAPLLLALVLDGATGDADVPWDERVLSAGCALQNLLLTATAQGFGSALTSGQALQSAPLRALLGLGAQQQALCFVSVGTVAARKPARLRPPAAAYVATLVPGKGMQPGWDNA